MSFVKHNRLKLSNVKVVTSDVINQVSQFGETQKIRASDVKVGDFSFGSNSGINYSGNIAITTCPFEGTTATESGAAYIFVKNSSDIWNEQQRIKASDAQANDQFGSSCDINASGNMVVVGARGEDTIASGAGAIYVFNKNSSDIWFQRQKIQTSDAAANDRIGQALSTNSDGTIVIAGGRYVDTGGAQAGAAYIFTKNSSDIWSEQQKLQSSDIQANDRFGTAVAINRFGNTAIIGASGEDTGFSGAGAAYIFNKNSSDIWNEQQKIQASDRSQDSGFGASVSINSSGNVLAVSATGDDAGASNSGAIYIFNKNSSDVWNEQQKIKASDISVDRFFGRRVSLNSAGNALLTGVNYDDTLGTRTGAVYLFTKNSSDVWRQKQKFQSSDIQSGDDFGWSAVLNGSGNTCFVGAINEDTPGINIGVAYTFQANNFDTIPIGGIVYSDVQTFETFVMKSDSILRIKI